MKHFLLKHLQVIWVTFCLLLIFLGSHLPSYGKRIDIVPSKILYPNYSNHNCEDFKQNSYPYGKTFFIETENSYDTFICDKVFLFYYKWEGLSSFPKTVNNSQLGCFDFNGKEYPVDFLIEEYITPKQKFVYSCNSFENTKRWVVQSHVL